MATPIKATLPKAEREVSMTMDVREFLSQVGLDMSGPISKNSTPKTLTPVVILTPPPNKLGDLSEPVDTSSQMSTPDDAEMGKASLEEIPTAPSPTAETTDPSGSAPPTDVDCLWEEVNKALGGLLATKSSINDHWQKLVWELGMALCQNDSKTTESIKEAKAICTHSTQEAKTLCCMAIGDTKVWGASQADSLQWSHAKSIQHLEEQAIKEESKGQLNFLSACQATLQASPVELHHVLVASYHILLGQALISHPFSFHKELPPLNKCLPPWLLPSCTWAFT